MFDKTLFQNGFRWLQSDHCFFVHFCANSTAYYFANSIPYFLLYVDYILVIGSDEHVRLVKLKLLSIFKICEIEVVKTFLGVQFHSRSQ